jgi:hypothetical protein
MGCPNEGIFLSILVALGILVSHKKDTRIYLILEDKIKILILKMEVNKIYVCNHLAYSVISNQHPQNKDEQILE